jgi:hypothetical protein
MCDSVTTASDDARSELIDQLIGATGARPNDHVIIVGTHLDLLLGLLRRGFAGATCAAGRCPIGGETADLLLVPVANSPEQLRDFLPQLLRCLRPGGTAVLHNSEGRALRRRELRQLLRELGLSGLNERSCADGVLLTARKPSAICLSQVA